MPKAKPEPESKPPINTSVRKYLSEIGREGGKIGGKKRALTLSKKRRKEIAVQGGKARALRAKKKAA